MRAIDTETGGIDLRHGGANPFFVTICDEDQNQLYWEWDVDPLNRQPIVPEEDKRDILDVIKQVFEEEDGFVLQNTKFDVKALFMIMGPEIIDIWDWSKVWDTLLSAHLLGSNQLKDLTTQALVYLGLNIKPLEDALKEASKDARAIARKHFPTWRIAKEGLLEMPSAKEEVAKYDGWLPRAMVKEAIMSLNFYLLPPHPQQPIIVEPGGDYDVEIDCTSKWGLIDPKGSVDSLEYALWLWNSPELLADLGELHRRRIGGYESIEQAKILRALCHPWRTVLSEYGNADSAVTIMLKPKHEKEIKRQGYWEIFSEGLKLPQVIYKMEDRGITISEKGLVELETEYVTESARLDCVCRNIAKEYDYDLTLPKGGTNKSLTTFVFDYMKLPVVGRTKKTQAPQLDKRAIEEYQATLPENSIELRFINSVSNKRSRDTAIGFQKSYRKYWFPWVPVGPVDSITRPSGWYVLHPSLNITGSDTLRFTSSNPNNQQISKKEGFNLRSMFGPAPGREWWSMDAKNIELRLPAYESGEQLLIDLFERPDEPPYYGSTHLLNFHTVYPDIWDKELSQVGIEKVGPHCKKKFNPTWYQWCKNGGFAVQYGAVEKVGGTADKAFHRKGAHSLLKERFSKLTKLNDYWVNYANNYGYVETMPDKSICAEHGYPLLCTRTHNGSILPTVPLNYHIQGTAMWWMRRAMVRCQDYLDELNDGLKVPQYFMPMQIHDELVFDFPRGKGDRPWLTNLPKIRWIARLMSQGGDGLGVPTPVGIEYNAKNWSEGITI